MLEQSQRALDIMRAVLPEQRRQARVHMPISARVRFDAQTQHPAFLRDMNLLGAFFYCNQPPVRGGDVVLEFAMLEGDREIKVSSRGMVVRIEKPTRNGGAVGVAIEFDRLDMGKNATTPARKAQLDKPFIHWTVEMVERLFTTDPELRRLPVGQAA